MPKTKFGNINIGKDADNTVTTLSSTNDKAILINGNIQVGVVNSEGNTEAGIKIKDRTDGNFKDIFIDSSSVKFKDSSTTVSLIREDELTNVVNSSGDPLIFSNVHIDMKDGNGGIINFFDSTVIPTPDPNTITAPVGLRRNPLTGRMQFRNDSADWFDIPGSTFQANVSNPQDGEILIYDLNNSEFKNVNFTISRDSSPQLGGNLDTNDNHIKFANNYGFIDSSNNKLLVFDDTNSSANFDLLISKTTSGPKIAANGNDTNIDLDIHSKGTGDIKFNVNSNELMILSNDAGGGGNGILKLNGLLNIDSGSAYHYSITGQTNSLAADRTLTLPLLTDNDTFVFEAHTQTLTNKTLTTPKINDNSSNNQYIFAGSELAANRTVTLPVLGDDDEFVFKNHTQTLTNKTLTSPTIESPTITGTGSIAGTFTGTLSAISGSTVGNLTLANGSITDSSGAISFGDENLSTTGTLASGNLNVTGTGTFSSTVSAATGSTIGSLNLADGSITDSGGSISFGDENLSTTGTLASGNLNVTGTGTFSSTVSAATGSTIGSLNLADGSITDSGGSISFGDENLSTTGTLASGNLNVTGTGTFSSTVSAATGSTIGSLNLADGSITDSGGAISFGDENLSTTGTLASGNLNVTGTGTFSSTVSAATGSTIGSLNLADGSITDSGGSISFGDENLSTTGTLASGNLNVTGTGTFSSTVSAATGSTIGSLNLADGSITDSGGSISFGNENLSTTGTLASGNLNVTGTGTFSSTVSAATGSTVGNITLANGSITDSAEQ